MAFFRLTARNGFGVLIFLFLVVVLWQVVIRRALFADVKFTSRLIKYDRLEHASYLIYTPGCNIPQMDPYDPTIKSLIHEVNVSMIHDSCGRLPPLTYLTPDNKIHLDANSLDLYNISNEIDVRCCILEIFRDSQGADEDDYQ